MLGKQLVCFDTTESEGKLKGEEATQCVYFTGPDHSCGVDKKRKPWDLLGEILSVEVAG